MFLTILFTLQSCATPSPAETKIAVEKLKKERDLKRVHINPPIFTKRTDADSLTQTIDDKIKITVVPLHTFEVKWSQDRFASPVEPAQERGYDKLYKVWSKLGHQPVPKVFNASHRFEFKTESSCKQVYRTDVNPIVSVSVNGKPLKNFAAKGPNNKFDKQSLYLMKGMTVLPGIPFSQVSYLVADSDLPGNSGKMDITVFDLPNCDGSKRVNLSWHLKYQRTDIKLIEPYQKDSMEWLYVGKAFRARANSFREKGFGPVSVVHYIKPDGSPFKSIQAPIEPITNN